ncbi:MAG: alpha/beta hydrolase [Clostridia bacterium]|nr:alpha/beta hydrolase [Clostridia bacterium]
MQVERVRIKGIPALIWGPPSDRVYLCVHGKMSCKESVQGLAEIAAAKGYQTISFDLPQHGERKNEDRRCDIWNGIRDLTTIGEYVFGRWAEVSLYACSLGAYFSLHAYGDQPFRRCLFQSPVLDMELLIRRMMLWFGITPERLAAEREIETPIDLMTWDYYQYVLSHPVQMWRIPTRILYGARDTLQPLGTMQEFADRSGCGLTVAEGSDHPFMEPGDEAIVHRWLEENL